METRQFRLATESVGKLEDSADRCAFEVFLAIAESINNVAQEIERTQLREINVRTRTGG